MVENMKLKTRITLGLLFNHLLKRACKNERVKEKIFRKSLVNDFVRQSIAQKFPR